MARICKQILITVGGLIVAGQPMIVVWGAEPLAIAKPAALRGSLILSAARRSRPTAWSPSALGIGSLRPCCWC